MWYRLKESRSSFTNSSSVPYPAFEVDIGKDAPHLLQRLQLSLVEGHAVSKVGRNLEWGTWGTCRGWIVGPGQCEVLRAVVNSFTTQQPPRHSVTCIP